MGVTDRLLRQNNRDRIKKRKAQNDDDEPTMRYKDKAYEYWAINQNKQSFESPMGSGINNAPSIFDSKAVFRTR